MSNCFDETKQGLLEAAEIAKRWWKKDKTGETKGYDFYCETYRLV
jgi:hypothetical protein